MILYAATVFVSAFLLFLVQPLLAKYILPWFGGSPGVWTTCLLFFQAVLTAGYGYAHLLASRLNTRRQVMVTSGLLLASVALLPITPLRTWGADDALSPAWRILELLLVSVGACYFILSSSGPLMQSWFSQTRPGESPYRLYTLSNLGSLLAIVSYPFVIEPNLGLNFQTKLWSWSFCFFVILCGGCAAQLWAARPSGKAAPAFESQTETPCLDRVPSRSDRLLWLSLAAMASAMLMATTNQLCLDVAVIPMLWLLPMALYLASFIICFQNERWYSRIGFGIALVIALAQTCVVLKNGIFIGLPLQIASYSFTLFICCMVCNGELVRLKPRPLHLTSFYLMISAGGALGGVFVSLIAPHIFKGYWEFHVVLAGTALVFLVILMRDRHSRLYAGRPSWAWTLIYLSFLALLAALGFQIRDTVKNTLVMRRNFFGVLKVLEDGTENPAQHRRVLMHGRIEHGYQFAAEDKRYWPTSYFGPTSGVGVAIQFHPSRLDPKIRRLRVGVVGLGTGTLAAYGQAGDTFRFYEINPEVLQISRQYFTYRQDSAAQVEVVLGDARISMEREKDQEQPGRFDVLAVDAFSSDAIPVHLLTRECYRIYRYHLKPDGILAMHISSRYFNLAPVIRSLADIDACNGVQAVLVEDEGNRLQETDATRWILLTSNKQFLADKRVQAAITAWADDDSPPLLFTDDYSNLFHLLRKKKMFE
jgi:hypothetical protein